MTLSSKLSYADAHFLSGQNFRPLGTDTGQGRGRFGGWLGCGSGAERAVDAWDVPGGASGTQDFSLSRK